MHILFKNNTSIYKKVYGRVKCGSSASISMQVASGCHVRLVRNSCKRQSIVNTGHKVQPACSECPSICGLETGPGCFGMRSEASVE
jgi:hypothetical protein